MCVLNSITNPASVRFVSFAAAVLSVTGYGYSDSRISYSLVGGGSGVISTDEIDWATTTRVNNQRGVHLTLHSGHVDTASANPATF